MMIPHLLAFLITSIQASLLVSRSESVEYSISPTHNLCMTPECVMAAADVIYSIDKNVDPCEDFYRFACGGWMDRHFIPDETTSVSVFDKAEDDVNVKLRVLLENLDGSEQPAFVKMVKELYDTCMDVEAIEKAGSEPLKEILKSLGGWPVIEGSHWNESNFDWLELLTSLRNLGYSHDILLSLSVIADYRNDTAHIIKLDETLFMDRTHLLNGLNDSVTAAYFKLMVQSAKLLGADKKYAEDELLKALHFEIALANFTLPREERRNISEFYNKYTVKELQEAIPQIPWLKYFNGLLSDEICENETLIVPVPEFVKNVADLISHTEKRVVANFMLWRTVSQSLPTLSKAWRNLAHKYSSVLFGKRREEPRWKQCLSSIVGKLRIGLSSYYVRRYFKEEDKDAALEIVKYIRKEFLNILKANDWMGEESKEQAIAKANSMESYIGYPTELLNDTAVLEIYKNLTISNETHFENTKRLWKWSTDYAFLQLRKPNIREEWKKHAISIEVNSFYDPVENSIDFPAGILQNAFFNKDRPHYMNFGAIGSVIGHEITHSFDDSGRQFDKDGGKVNWWDNTTDENFKARSQCIIDQYSNYTTENGMAVNGVATQSENIADTAGLKEAYRAYQSWVEEKGPEKMLPALKYSQSQLFWISAANVWCANYQPEALENIITSKLHSPNQFRVVGPMSNLAEFAKDFNCSPDSPMNKQPKCQVW